MFLKKSWSPSKILFIFNLIIIFIIFILGFRPQVFQKKIGIQDLAYYQGQALNLRGMVCQEADLNFKNQRLTVCINEQVKNHPEEKIKGKLLITSSLYPAYNYGDFIDIHGYLQAPSKFQDFDYPAYLARYGIYSLMYYPHISKVSGNLNLSQKVYLYLIKFKETLRDKINFNLPEPEASLANALLLGYRRGVAKEDLNIFARVGLSHMIAISGAHIAILSALVLNFLLALGLHRRQAFIFIFIFLILYPLLTGLSASAVRAGIMGILATFALYSGRSSSLIRSLVMTATLMLILNPQILRQDIGFQLSFLALLGIIYIYPLGQKSINSFLNKFNLSFKKKNILKNILETANLALVAQLVILPISLINFKQLSLIAPLSNVLVLWAFPILLASLIIALILSFLFPFLGILWFSLSYFLLRYIYLVSRFLSQANWVVWKFTNFNWYLGFFYYFLLIFVFYLVKRRRRKRELKV